MSDCPYCDAWRYDPSAACIYVRPIGDALPLIYRGGLLQRARGTEAPDGRSESTAVHISREHPLAPEVLAFGPLEEYAPIARLNAVLSILGR